MLSIRRKLFKSRKGFTLIELIVVIAILAILAVLAVPRFLGTLDNARLRTDQAVARTIVSAAALYEAERTTEDQLTTANFWTQMGTGEYLDITEAPVSQSNNGTFVVTVTNGSVSQITDGTITLYPVPSS